MARRAGDGTVVGARIAGPIRGGWITGTAIAGPWIFFINVPSGSFA